MFEFWSILTLGIFIWGVATTIKHWLRLVAKNRQAALLGLGALLFAYLVALSAQVWIWFRMLFAGNLANLIAFLVSATIMALFGYMLNQSFSKR